MTGAAISVDCCLRRTLLKGRFETTYISPSQVVSNSKVSKNSLGFLKICLTQNKKLIIKNTLLKS